MSTVVSTGTLPSIIGVASQYTAGRYKAWDDNGTPMPLARLYTYESGTTTHKSVYASSALTTPCTYTPDGAGGQYLEMNARGEFDIWLGAGFYTMTLRTPTGALIFSTDGVTDARSQIFDKISGTGGAAFIGWIRNAIGAVGFKLSDWLGWQNPSVLEFALPVDRAKILARTFDVDVTYAFIAAHAHCVATKKRNVLFLPVATCGVVPRIFLLEWWNLLGKETPTHLQKLAAPAHG